MTIQEIIYSLKNDKGELPPDSVVAKAMEQYVIKARIEELEKASEYWLHDCASYCDGRIAQLEKEGN